MTRLLDLYDPYYRDADDALDELMGRAAKEIAATPRWRWLKRWLLKQDYEFWQRKMYYLREAADQDVRDRLLVQSARETEQS